MNLEQFIIKQIINGKVIKQEVVNDVIKKYLAIYRESRVGALYGSVGKMVLEARKELITQGALIEGVTVKKFAEVIELSESAARAISNG